MGLKKENVRIMVVDSDDLNRNNIILLLEREGYDVFSSAEETVAMEMLKQHRFHILFSSLRVGEFDGIQFMRRAKEICADLEVIFVTEDATVESAVQAMMAGAFSYLARPFSIEHFFDLVEQALEKTIHRRMIRKQHGEIRRSKGITFIGKNPLIIKLKSDIAEIAQHDANVLITGETGTGKELIASTIHALSRRADKRFLPINCSALTEELMHNELFGHEKEAFTGASKFRTGLFESADGGVMLLDEIGEMPTIMQVKLLRVLQEKKLIRVGGTRQVPVDVRILAATNRDLKKEVKRGNFRQDLYYRLNVVSLEMPPLRKRRDDIPLLIEHFLAKYLSRDQKVRSISPEALDVLVAYDYPGNVRELENIIERSLAICRERMIRIRHLPPDLDRNSVTVGEKMSCTCTLAEHEQNYILKLLDKFNGNKTKTAAVLGIDRVSLWRKLKKYEENNN